MTLGLPGLLVRTASRRFAVAGTPTDAINLALRKLFTDKKPDLVISGINHGENLADDITYSGTISAAMEGALAGIRSVAEGHTVLAPAIAATLVTRMRSERPDRPTLSPREVEVLRLVAAGRSNPEIGRDLFIGEATVKTHLLHVFEKLGVSDRTRAVTLALELGIL